MRLSDFLVVLNITALAHGSCGTSAAAGWDPKAAASNSRETRSARRVFNSLDQDGHPRRTVAFLGRRPSTATKRTPGESNPEVAVGELPNPAAADAGEVVGSTDTSADDCEQEPAEPRWAVRRWAVAWVTVAVCRDGRTRQYLHIPAG